MNAPRPLPIAAALAMAGLAVWLVTEEKDAPAPPSEAPAAERAEAGPAPVPLSSPAGEPVLEPHATLAFAADDLPSGRPLVVTLRLREPSIGDEPRPVRVYAEDRRVLETSAALASDRTEAKLPIDPAFLTPGRYVVEITTTERDHFQALRYAIEIR